MRRQDTEGAALKIVEPVETARGGERKRRRLAATIARPEPNRPRLPAQGDTAAMFDTESWRRRWAAIRPMAETTNVYVAGCPGTMALGGILGVPIFKPGDGAGRRGEDAQAQRPALRQRRHLGFRRPRRTGLERLGGREAERPIHSPGLARARAAALAGGRVALLDHARRRTFEALIQAALDPHITLARCGGEPARASPGAGRRGCDPHTLLRYSRGPRGPKMATEICAMAPSGDAGRLVALAEWIVIHLACRRRRLGGVRWAPP